MGNSGGGTLTAYIAALDPRVTVAAIGCYITTLRRRMGNRIQEDPVRRPRAGHLRLRQRGDRPRGAPRPARAPADAAGHGQLRFLPDRGGQRVVRGGEAALRGRRRRRSDRPGRGGRAARTRPARSARPSTSGSTAGSPAARKRLRSPEIAVRPRPDKELLVCPDGQVNVSLRSRPFLPMAWEEFERKPKPARIPLRDLLGLDPGPGEPPRHRDRAVRPGSGQTAVVLINGNESRDWREETELLKAVAGPRPCGRRGRSARGGPVRDPRSSRRPAITPTRSAAWRRTSPTTHSSSASRSWGCGWRMC